MRIITYAFQKKLFPSQGWWTWWSSNGQCPASGVGIRGELEAPEGPDPLSRSLSACSSLTAHSPVSHVSPLLRLGGPGKIHSQLSGPVNPVPVPSYEIEWRAPETLQHG